MELPLKNVFPILRISAAIDAFINDFVPDKIEYLACWSLWEKVKACSNYKENSGVRAFRQEQSRSCTYT